MVVKNIYIYRLISLKIPQILVFGGLTLLFIHVPGIDSLRVRKSGFPVLAVEDNDEDAIFETGQTTSCWSCLPCFYALPAFLKQDVGVVPSMSAYFYLLLAPAFLHYQLKILILMHLGIHDPPESSILGGITT